MKVVRPPIRWFARTLSLSGNHLGPSKGHKRSLGDVNPALGIPTYGSGANRHVSYHRCEPQNARLILQYILTPLASDSWCSKHSSRHVVQEERSTQILPKKGVCRNTLVASQQGTWN